jgi:hypothetical protein
MEPRPDLDAVDNKKWLALARNHTMILGCPAHSQVTLPPELFHFIIFDLVMAEDSFHFR